MVKESKLLKKLLCADSVVLGAVMLVRAIYFFLCNSVVRTVDSVEFLNINSGDFLKGSPDRYRLPVYPLFLDMCSKLFGSKYLLAACVIQLLVSLASMVLLYFTLRKLCDKRYIYLPVTVLYGLSVAVAGWDKVVLTESFSLSLTVAVLFGLVYYIKENKLRYIAVAAAAVTVGAFLRAVFSVYAGLIFGFLILRLIFTGKKDSEEKKNSRIKDIKGLGFATVPVVLLLVYAFMFSSQYGAFTLSDSGLGQQLYIVLENGYYRDGADAEIEKAAQDILKGRIPESYKGDVKKLLKEIHGNNLTEEQFHSMYEAVTKDIPQDKLLSEEYIDSLNKSLEKIYGESANAASFENVYRARCYIMDNFDRDRVSEFVNTSKNANLKSYVLSLYKTSKAQFAASYEGTKDSKVAVIPGVFVKSVVPQFTATLAQGMVIGLAELGIYVFVLIRKRYSEWIHLGFAAMILSTGVLSIFGTNAEFGRTALTMYPMLFVVLAMWATFIISKIIKKETERSGVSLSE